jgi:hypothetical protein
MPPTFLALTVLESIDVVAAGARVVHETAASGLGECGAGKRAGLAATTRASGELVGDDRVAEREHALT